jgi:drug/metabolite transporter (DMT)-like permease
MTWFVLALVAAFLFTVTYIIDDNLVTHIYPGATFATIVSGMFNLLPIAACLIYPAQLGALSSLYIGLAIAAGILTQLAIWFYFRAFAHDTPSVVAIVDIITPAFVPFLAYWLVAETLSFAQYGGLAIIILASLGITAPSLRRIGRSPALGLIMLSALLAAPGLALQKLVYTQIDVWTGFVLFSAGVFATSFALMTLTRHGRAFYGQFRARAGWRWISAVLVSETFALIAFFIQHIAFSIGPVSLVTVIMGTTPIFVLLISISLFPFMPRLFRDQFGRHTFRKLGFMLIMVGGIYLVRINGG